MRERDVAHTRFVLLPDEECAPRSALRELQQAKHPNHSRKKQQDFTRMSDILAQFSAAADSAQTEFLFTLGDSIFVWRYRVYCDLVSESIPMLSKCT